MADLQGLQDFAAEHNFDLTSPLRHEQVVTLAENWLPLIFFHEQEKFHPISLDEVISMVENLFGQLPPIAQAEWQVSKFVRTGAATGEVRRFNPPVVHVPDDPVLVSGRLVPTVRVINVGSPIRDAFEHPDVDKDAFITHGASFHSSNQFFGGLSTLSGSAEASADDPFLPRATGEDGQPRITVLASLKNLLETLKYELAVEEAEDYPPDGLRGGFDIAAQLFRQFLPQFPLLPSMRRKVLQDLIAAHEAGEPLSAALKGLPPGWELNESAWDAVTRYAFLEYDFFYAYNDFNRVNDTLPFYENEHEGDAEGCCLVFDRNVLNIAAANGDSESLLRAVPHSIITSVHEEKQKADDFKFIPPPIPPANDPDRLPRQIVDLNVYVAWASHATYFTPGDHDLVDFQDIGDYFPKIIPLPILIHPSLPLAILLAIIEHFIDTEDKTSTNGIRIGPDEVIGDHPLAVAKRLLVMPMSDGEHIYEPEHEDLLRLRAFAGKWGGHDGIIDKSGPFEAKTGRYFRKLLASL